MTVLTAKQLYINQPVPVTQPALQVHFVKPLSYQFRVAEMLDDNGKIESVKLQMEIWEHDEYGCGIVKQCWADVPRVKFNKNGAMIIP
jgi:hypothetical protein